MGTLVSDMATVICLDDYHLNDREGRKVSGLTALNTAEQKFDLMYEHVKALKEGKTVMKPIYNHVNGTLDTPEEIEPTPVIIIEGLHAFVTSLTSPFTLTYPLKLSLTGRFSATWRNVVTLLSLSWPQLRHESLTLMPTSSPKRNLLTTSLRFSQLISTRKIKRL